MHGNPGRRNKVKLGLRPPPTFGVRARPCGPRACMRTSTSPRGNTGCIGLRHYGRKLLIFIYPAESCPAFHEGCEERSTPLGRLARPVRPAFGREDNGPGSVSLRCHPETETKIERMRKGEEERNITF